MGKRQHNYNRDEAWRQFHGDNSVWLYETIRRWGLQEADAADITAKTFVKAFVKFGNPAAISAENLRAYLRAMAKNISIDKYHDELKGIQTEGQDNPAYFLAESPTQPLLPEYSTTTHPREETQFDFDSTELLSRLRQKCSPDTIAIYRRVKGDGLTYNQAAKEFGKTPEAVRKAVYRVGVRIAKIKKEMGIDGP